MAKTAKRGANDAKKTKKKKKNKNSGPKAAAMKVKTPKDNPFETIWSSRKFDILGKKRGKGEERRMGLTRAIAIEKRKKTLLKEYEQSGKSSVFVDKRIGENNDELGEFDKGIMRSQRQLQLKMGKKSKYNLSDGEEEDFDIPHLGSLPKDDFGEEMLSDDDKDAGEANESRSRSRQLSNHEAPFIGQQHIEEGQEKKHKSKKEVMEEVMLKSKYFKAQKAKEKEENEQLMEELDKNFTSLVQSQVLLSLTEPGKINALKALVNKDISTEHLKKDNIPVTKNLEAQDMPDSYDKLVKEMSLDICAFPSDRTKTPEEIAQEERERLEQLEEERMKRMSANDSSDEEDGDVEKLSKGSRFASGDDLGDSFTLDDEHKPKKGWVDEILERRDADDESDGSDEDEEDGDEEEEEEESEGEGASSEDNTGDYRTGSLKDWERSDDDNLGTDLEEDEEENDDLDDEDEDEAMAPRGHTKSKKNEDSVITEGGKGSMELKKVKHNSLKQDIPFLIEAPTNSEELSALLDNCSNDDIITIVGRIRKTNSIKLAAGNRKKMQVFYGLLLQYFAVLANKKPLNFELLNMLVKPLIEMSMEIPYFSAICARQRILQTRAQFSESIKNSETSFWPSMKTLSLMRLWSLIFPCSDFRHVVMTPAILLMCEYLMRCPIFSGRDVAVGSFLCSILLSGFITN